MLHVGGGTPLLLKLATVAVVLVVGFQFFTRRDWLTGAGWSTFALIASLAWLVPWYVVWLLPLAALGTSVRLRRISAVLTVFLIFAFLPVTTKYMHDHDINPLNTPRRARVAGPSVKARAADGRLDTRPVSFAARAHPAPVPTADDRVSHRAAPVTPASNRATADRSASSSGLLASWPRSRCGWSPRPRGRPPTSPGVDRHRRLLHRRPDAVPGLDPVGRRITC